MATNIGYVGHTDSKQKVSILRVILRGIVKMTRKVIRALSFNADNIAKSKEWPYY